ncbi:flagellar biosynthesis anti-sigma factor FlgM [Rubripirellula obstinata]|nr:flagellar biosynthesis anti-sigma factor FlgM [Rubripirellula obstinata]
MQIYGPYRVSTAQNAAPANRAGQAPKAGEAAAGKAAAKPTAAPVDQLDLSSTSSTSAMSGVNRLASASPIAGGGEIRLDKVANLRREIASGNYETPEKLDAALDRMLDSFA